MADNPILALIERKLPRGWGLRAGQVDAICGYFDQMNLHDNIAIHLPTGYGKTLVGLAVAEYRRQEMKDKPVWLCPTRQLCHQVVQRAKELGIAAHAFVGALGGAEDRAAYERWMFGGTVAVTAYQRIFARDVDRISPEAAAARNFDKATFAVLDDVHRAEQAVSDYWTLTLERWLQFVDRATQEDVGERFHNPAYFDLLEVLGRYLPDRIRKWKLSSDYYPGTEKVPYEGGPVYCIPFPVLADRVEVIKGRISQWLHWKNVQGLQQDLKGYDKQYHDPLFFQRQVWDNIKDQLYFMHVFVSRQRIVLRPYLCPVGDHPVWRDIKNRLFMSATMHVDGEIQKLFGIEDIHHVQQTVDVVEGTGRRVILGLDPELELPNGQNELDGTLEKINRMIVITPGERSWEELAEKAPAITRKKIFPAEETERNLDPFFDASDSVLQYYGRYEGLDIPNDRCRTVLLFDRPAGLSPMEAFLTFEIGCEGLVARRIASRLEQGLGRCNRRPRDLSAILLDQKTHTWVGNQQELMSGFAIAEMRFSVGLPETLGISDRSALVETFLADDSFRNHIATLYDNEISPAERAVSVGSSAPPHGAWQDEIGYASHFWNRRYDTAYQAALKVAEWYRTNSQNAPGGPNTDLIRSAWWLYLAGIARACLDRRPGSPFDYTRAIVHWREAMSCMEDAGAEEDKLQWWRTDLLSSVSKGGEEVWREILATPPPRKGTLETDCLFRQADAFRKLVNSRKFTMECFRLRQFLQALPGQEPDYTPDASKRFERGLETLGAWLGFISKPPKPKGADGVWQAKPGRRPNDDVVIILEAKSSEQALPDDPVDKESLHQLDHWKSQETHALQLTGREKVYLVRIGRKKGAIHPDLRDDERLSSPVVV